MMYFIVFGAGFLVGTFFGICMAALMGKADKEDKNE